MIAYFDKDGVLREVVYDTPERVGSEDINKVYAFIERDGVESATFMSDSRGIETSISSTTTIQLSNTDGTGYINIGDRDLKYFQYYKDYDFYVYEMVTADLTEGLRKMTIRAVLDDDATNPVILALGELLYEVEDNIIVPDGAITRTQYDSIIAQLGGKQDTLVSGTNIKTINDESILGSGNLDINSTPDNITLDLNSEDKLEVKDGGVSETKLASELSTKINDKSTVSVSQNGSSTDIVNYITIDGVQKKIGSGLEKYNYIGAWNCETGLANINQTIPYTYQNGDYFIINNVIECRSDLPSGYKQVEYVESDGTNYIDLNIPLKNTYATEIVYMVTNMKENFGLFGSRTATNSQNIEIATLGTSYCYMDFNNSNYATTRAIITTAGVYLANVKYKATINKSTRQLENYNSGEVLVVNSTETSDTILTNNAYLFAVNGGLSSECMQGRIYSFVINEGTTKVLDLVPCYRESDNTIGLYDVVTNTFYTMTGLTKGNDVINYKPNGTVYDGTASTTIETGQVYINDYYRYNGSTWTKESSSTKVTPFVSLVGSPDDNANLKTKFDSKQDKITTASVTIATTDWMQLSTDNTFVALKPITNLKSTNIVFVTCDYNSILISSSEQLVEIQTEYSKISLVSAYDNFLMFKCFEEKPTEQLIIEAIII